MAWLSAALGVVSGIASAVGEGFKFLTGRQKAKARAEDRQAGRNEQRLADSDAALKRERETNAERENLDRLDDPALNDELRHSMED